MKKLFFLILLAICMFNCANDSQSDLLDAPVNPDASINYTDDIRPIIQSACVSCHANPPVNGAPFSLVNFSQVNEKASNIISRISLQSGSPGAMPPSGRLPQATIDKVQQWIDDGKVEN